VDAGGFHSGTNALITVLGSYHEGGFNTYSLTEGLGISGLSPYAICFFFYNF